jgi:hypothetical protein
VVAIAEPATDDLPPATGSGSVINFIMSCKQAKSDVEHFAVKRAKQRLRDFAALLLKETGLQADISASLDAIDSNPCFAQLRQVDIAVPFDKIFKTPDLVDLPSHFEQRFSYRFVSGALRSIHTLLPGHHDTVHIRLSEYSPKREDSLFTSDTVTVTQRMYNALKHLGQAIRETNSGRLESRLSEDSFKGWPTNSSAQDKAEFHADKMEYWGDFHAYFVPTLEKVPATPFCTKEVRFSWDLRAEKEQGVSPRLRGQAYRLCYKEDYLRDEARLPIFYHVHDDDRTLVAMGFRSSNGWQKSDPDGYDELRWAVPNDDDGLGFKHNHSADRDDLRAADCSCSDIGAALELGDFF